MGRKKNFYNNNIKLKPNTTNKLATEKQPSQTQVA